MVDFRDVQAAAERLRGVAHRTPVAASRLLDEACECRVRLKCENLQRAGAFKFRGAYNAISSLSEAEKGRGVITYSSGNHAQAVALVCRLLGVSATVVMPVDAPSAKIEATRGYGADVMLYDPARRSREEIAHSIAAERGLAIVPPFDHPAIISGQGTAALELLQETGDLDLLLVPCGGGGLLSGSAITVDRICPGCRVVGVEPEAGDDATRSFRTGILQKVHNPETIADGARTSSLGKYTFPLIQAHVDEMMTVTDEELVRAMKFVWTRLKLVVEPTGVLGLAALLSGGITCRDGRVGVILSGGNVDLETAMRWFAG